MTSTLHHTNKIDKSFDPAKCTQYKLYIEVGADSLKLVVLDQKSETFIGFESFNFGELINEYAILQPINEALSQSKLIGLAYDKVIVSFQNTRGTLIPNAIFKAEELKAYHRFNFAERDEDVYLADRLINLNAHHVFAVPDYLLAPFKKLNNVQFRHSSSSFIEASLLAARNEKALSSIWVNVTSNSFQLSVIKNQDLAFFNSFNYKSAEDFIYFLLFALDQLDINNEEASINLVGNISKTSVLYPILFKYIKTLNFRKFEGPIKLSYVFEDEPDQMHFSLFSQYLCE